MIHLLGVHTLDEAQIIRHAAGVLHEVTDPRPRLAILPIRLDRREHLLACRVAGHRAESFSLEIRFGNWLPVHLLLKRIVIEQIGVCRCTIHEHINDTLCLRRVVRKVRQATDVKLILIC